MDICTKQHELIRTELSPLINNDYIFIDLPYYSNIGDSLIWKGTETFLSTLPYKCLYRASCKTFKHIDIPRTAIIILMGGGNWGDLYLIHNEFRKRIINEYPNNKIIILPQTVYYEGARNARNDATTFRKHKNLIIYARDKYSYWFLKLFRFGNNIRLMPDMAFYIDFNFIRSVACPKSKNALLFKRIDKEKNDISERVKLLIGSDYDTSDWPMYGGFDPMYLQLCTLINNREFTAANQYAIQTYLPKRVQTGIEFISKYHHVVSNRLHGAILAILLGKETYILDNSYGKNSQYYNTWLKNTDKIHFLKETKSFNFVRKKRFLYHMLLGIFSR